VVCVCVLFDGLWVLLSCEEEIAELGQIELDVVELESLQLRTQELCTRHDTTHATRMHAIVQREY
jgi:hypothetical protein